jgi:di/tricarboxylate transporter
LDPSLAVGWEAWFTLGLVVLCFVLFAFTRIAPDVVTSGALPLLLVSGVLDTKEALAGFSNQGMLTVGVLYVVVSGLTETGAVGWIGQGLLGRPRGETWARLRLMAPVAALSCFLNNTPVVAIFIPAVQDWAKRNRLELSRLLIPLSYATIAGGTVTLIGTSTNLVVNSLYVERLEGPGLSFFEPAWVGIPVTLTVLLYLLTAGHWLLPRRRSAAASYEDTREYTAEMLVAPGSPLIGKSIEEAGLRQLPGLFLIEIERDDQVLPAVSSATVLRANDRLVFAGILDSVMDLQKTRGLVPATNQVFKLDTPRPGRCFVEAVISDKCPLIGKNVREGRFRNRYGAVIIAIARNGRRVDRKIGDVEILAGDTLLLETRPSFVEQQKNSRDFLLVSRIGNHHPPRHERAPLAIGITAAMVAVASVGWFSMLEAALLAAGLMILTQCTNGRTARQAPDWQVLVVIATSFGIGTALETTGAASLVAGGLIGLAKGDPWGSLALVFVATSLLTSFATNNVAAVLVFPIAVQAAAAIGVSPLPFVITVMIGASAEFATPIGYQTNLMVYNVGGYHFTDFVRVGLPLNVLVGMVTILVVPLVWHF